MPLIIFFRFSGLFIATRLRLAIADVTLRRHADSYVDMPPYAMFCHASTLVCRVAIDATARYAIISPGWLCSMRTVYDTLRQMPQRERVYAICFIILFMFRC